MLKEAERGQGWDSNPGPLDLSPRSPDCPMPGSWGYPSAVGRNPRGRKPSLAEPPNPSASRTAAEPVRQHQIPTQAPAHPWPAHAARSAVTLPTATFPGLSTPTPPASSMPATPVTHHEGPSPLVLAEAVASPGPQGRRGHLPEWPLVVPKGILPS